MKDSSQTVLCAVNGNSLRLDGGAMFGNAPKALWRRWIDVDEHNLIPIASTALLVQTPSEKILFETGAGAYLSPEMKKRFQVVQDHHVLLESLGKMGVTHDQITHVVLSHLHFDHAGGLLKAWTDSSGSLELLFPNAVFITGKYHFERAAHPHYRDRASFIPDLPRLLEQSGRLKRVEEGDVLQMDGLTIEWSLSHGHTPGMLLSYIRTPGDCLLVAGDLAPGHPWVNLPITMGYDRFPESLIDEKQAMFKKVVSDDAWIFYTHDACYAFSKLSYDAERNRYRPESLTNDPARIHTTRQEG